ncbi:NADH:flavin oxidoreductase [Wukongibacter baidiensis]|uniref:NADH:flavin oxidoreductase n=1 Tax=Wukongibacter baidiensis TaxID=1723361 RepID=UPI003D7F239E
MKSLYEKINLGGIEVRNRFVRSGTHENMTFDGTVTPEIIDIYKKLAEEEVGLIITSSIEVTEEKVLNTSLRIYDDSYINSFKKLTSAVHEAEGKILAQLLYGGSQVFCKIDYETLGPSAVQDRFSKIIPKAMTNDDIFNIIECFSDAALRSKMANFDGVQINAASGFLLNKFLSPFYNRRSDEYGGSIENRSRFLVEIREAIAKKCGRDFPVFIKLSVDDFMNDDVKGLEFPDGKEIAKVLAESGYDAIEVSGGLPSEIGGSRRPTVNYNGKDPYFKNHIIELSKEVQTPLISVGGIRTEEVAQELINFDHIEAVSFSRPFICDPDLVKRWKKGEKARCTSCYQCNGPKGIRCVLNK